MQLLQFGHKSKQTIRSQLRQNLQLHLEQSLYLLHLRFLHVFHIPLCLLNLLTFTPSSSINRTNVLKSNNWQKYRPKLILTESLDNSSIAAIAKSSIGIFLGEQKYSLYAKTVNTLFFKDETNRYVS